MMERSLHTPDRRRALWLVVATTLLCLVVVIDYAAAKPQYRQAFYDVYPDSVGTVIETVPSKTNHCGVCHWKFGGGGQRNPFGVQVENALNLYPNNDQGYRDAIWSIRNDDPDNDGYSTLVEVTDVFNYTNTPTFPGLTEANVGGVSEVDVIQIQNHLEPSTGSEVIPPVVEVIKPNGGGNYEANKEVVAEWNATDASGIVAIDLYLSDDNGATFKPIALGLPHTGIHTWFAPNRPTTNAIIRIVATDGAFNQGHDDSDNTFEIYSPPDGIVPTTLRDFDMPGSQPFDAGILNPPAACEVCHGNYDSAVEPYFNWQGSMMAQASRDPLFEAAMVIANQDAPDSGDLCLRCHFSRGWLQGRSVPTDGSQMLATDGIGVACDLCHRMVDPIPGAANPAEDTAILDALETVPLNFGNGMYVIDPTGARRGPFADADSGHPILVSPFHREAAFCGTCHNVSNPAFEKDANGDYVPNALDAPAGNFAANVIAPVERTYSEWLNSDYNTPQGVYAPQFGGNKDYVATCQDCHMRDVTGQGCNANPPIRNDLPLHDMTGGSTWLPGLLSTLYPGEVDDAAMQAGIARARTMLQNAADMAVTQDGPELTVTVTNNTGHKLPTGYPEGRRIWINVRFYDSGLNLISESGAYDSTTGVLSHDAQAKIYEIIPVTSGVPGVPDGSEFHFVLNNAVAKDNRIPPRGFTNAAYSDFGGPPVAYSYADGQYWDDSTYIIPSTATSVEVALYYQSTSKEFVEFLLAENFTNSKGQELYDLWNNNGKCPPEAMVTTSISLDTCLVDADCNDTLYCNGLETCVNGFCANGVDPCPGQGCDEVTDTCYPLGCDDDGVCEQSEDCNNCPNDCFATPGGTCGDGICAGSGEDCFTCPTDCRCTGGGCINGCCGDGVCSGENASNCPVDCDPAFVPPAGTCCGDGLCEGTEDPFNCAVDCAQCINQSDCDDGLYCNGQEFCDGQGQCQPGTPPCNDGVGCTTDACDEVADTCIYTPVDAVCDNGSYCDGVEFCDAVLDCQPGTPVDCNDDVACTIDSCNEVTDTCDHTPDDSFCDNGLYCDGVEICDPVLSCQPGAPVDCDDSVSCTIDSCNESTDSCDHSADDSFCNNGLYCDGVESCDPILDCQSGTAVDCNDSVSCTVDSCNETTDSCDHTPQDSLCDNGLYCDGVESCDPTLDCQPSAPVVCSDGVSCTTDSCNEVTDACDHSPDDAVCQNGLYCDGAEYCDAQFDCQPGMDPCPNLTCDEANDRCSDCLVDADCDDGVYCNGLETCDAISGVCQPGVAVVCNDDVACTIDSCNESTDQCDHDPDHLVCDDGLFCTGVEMCDPAAGCQSSGNPCAQPATCDESSGTCGCLPPTITVVGPRYVEITSPSVQDAVGFIVTGVDADVSCVSSYIQEDGFVSDQPGSPVFMTPAGWGTVTSSGPGLIAGRTYDVQADCDQANPGTVLSEPLSFTMWRWGDADNSAVVDVLDISRSVDAFRGDLLSNTPCQADDDCLGVDPNFACDLASGFCQRVRAENADLLSAQGCTPDQSITILDIVAFVDAFRGIPHACVGPCITP